MKKNLILSVLMLVLSFLKAEAQIVYSEGRLNINNATKTFCYPLAADGWQGMYYTCKDSNFLQIDLTSINPRFAGSGNQIAFFNTETGTFNSIQVANVYNYSDARAKENVQELQAGLGTIAKLHPVNYEWKQEAFAVDSMRNVVPGGQGEEGKEQFGFLAQDVERVLPNVVESSEQGVKMINYIALVPVLVKAVQELQEIVDNQADLIEQLQTGNIAAKQASVNRISKCSVDNSSGKLQVSTVLEEGVYNAKLLVSSATGDKEREFFVSAENPSVDVNVSGLNKGVHVVCLYVDDKKVDSRSCIKE